MSPTDFVNRIREEVVEQNLVHYVRLLQTPSKQARDPQMGAVLAAYERMDAEQKEAMRTLVRQVLVDTVSNLFGILDGSSLLRGFRERFSLSYGESHTSINGSLQDIFLSTESS